MWAPSLTEVRASTGSRDAVTSAITSAPSAAACGEAAATTRGGASAQALSSVCKWAASRPQTRSSSNGLTRDSASIWLRACTPDASAASTRASGRARCLADAADTAAVRASVM